MVIEGDARAILPRMPADFAQCVVTSPPYWGLRDYGISGQIGLEDTLAGFITTLTGLFGEVRRVLRPDGVLWLNIGDGFTSGNRGWRAPDKKNPNRAMSVRPDNPPGLKDKDLLGVPWRLAFALQADGWYLRSEVIWHKPNAMPESVKDRPTRAHEHLFMFSKSERYAYYPDAVRERAEDGSWRNRRSVWSINTSAMGGSHIASFPEELVVPCVLGSTKPKDVVFDPFFGSGTVGVVARHLGRRYVGIELNPAYVREAERALSMPGNGRRRSGYRYPEHEHEDTLTLLETAGEHRQRSGHLPEALLSTGAVSHHPKLGPSNDQRRSRHTRGRG